MLVLADPVFRSKNILMRWKSLVPKRSYFAPEVLIPANVKRVKSTAQNQNTPHAHKLVALNPKLTKIDEPLVDPVLFHSQMDEAEVFHEMAEDAALRMIFPHKRH